MYYEDDQFVKIQKFDEKLRSYTLNDINTSGSLPNNEEIKSILSNSIKDWNLGTAFTKNNKEAFSASFVFNILKKLEAKSDISGGCSIHYRNVPAILKSAIRKQKK